MASIVVSGDTSGAVTISAPAVAGTPTLTLPTTTGTILTTASTTGVNASAISTGTLAQAYGGTGTTTGYYGFKNRIINGAMVIDQRNNGSSGTAGGYTVDRWNYLASQASKGTWQQNAGSVTPPVGFSNYLGFTSSSSYSVGAGDYFGFYQSIEGFNTADLGFGTANAKTITISFWVRCSLTGTFGATFNNYANNRCYPFTYTISSANTWEQKSVTIAGDTSGTWVGATNAGSASIIFGLGIGSTYSGTAGSWSGSTYFGATGATSVVGTNGATFYITGVQLEVGSTATSFDYRPYGTELQLCRRYTQVYRSSTNGILFPLGWYFDANNIRFIIMFDQEMRGACAVTFFGTANTDYLVMNNATGQSGFTWGAEQFGTRSVAIQAGKTSHGLSNQPTVNLYIATSNAGGIICSAEL